MKWSTALPSEPGWFWMRSRNRIISGTDSWDTAHKVIEVRIVRDIASGGKPRVEITSPKVGGFVRERDECGTCWFDAKDGYEWAGPIPQPDEAS